MTLRIKGYQRGDGRYPSVPSRYEEFPDITWENVGQYATSDDPLDRVAALAFLHEQVVRLPVLWVVIEDPRESPNLQRDGRVTTAERQIQQGWSAHVDRADADAWCAMFQAKTDAQCDRHPWWGPSSRRVFTVVLAAGAPASQLRQPGATPHTEAFE